MFIQAHHRGLQLSVGEPVAESLAAASFYKDRSVIINDATLEVAFHCIISANPATTVPVHIMYSSFLVQVSSLSPCLVRVSS